MNIPTNEEVHRAIRFLATEMKEPSNEVTLIRVCAEDYKRGTTYTTDALAKAVAQINANRGRILREAVYQADPISDENLHGYLGSFKLVFE